MARNGGNLAGGLKREIFAKLYKKTAFRAAISKVSKTREPQKWIFLVGCYNSGTTLLRDVLNEHPDIAALPFEGMRLTDAFEDLEASDWPRMMYRNKARWDLTDEGASTRVTQAKRDWAPFWDKRSSAFLEKSIDHSTRITWLDRHFGNVYVIGIFRNGLAVSEGILRRSRPKGAAILEVGETYPLTMVAEQWVEFSRRLHNDIDAVSHGHKLLYEDLMEQPRETLEEIFEFLEMSPPQIDIDGSMISINGRKFSFQNQNETSILRLPTEDRAQLQAVMYGELKRNGYIEKDASHGG